MKTFCREYFVVMLCILCTLLCTSVHAQIDSTNFDPDDPDGSIHTAVETQIHTQFGNDYSTVTFIVDSLLQRGRSTSDDEAITDPYNTLHGCILFGATRYEATGGDEKHSIFGIYKNGLIIWHSDSVIQGGLTRVYATADVNNDGHVDILTKWGIDQMFRIEYMWIFSWDGQNGSIINQFNQGDSNSMILSTDGVFELIDANGDGSKKIRAYWDTEDPEIARKFPNINVPTKPWVTYSWNGSQYGLWKTKKAKNRNGK